MKETDENKSEYEFFLTNQGEITPSFLSETIKRGMSEYTNPFPGKVVFKYIFVFILAGFISLFLCPQKGVGFLKNSYPLFFHALHSSKFLCGLYCGFFFFLITHVTTLCVLNHYEKLGIFTKLWIFPHGLFSLFFGGFMLVSEDLNNFSIIYNLSWLLAVLTGLWITKKFFSSSRTYFDISLSFRHLSG